MLSRKDCHRRPKGNRSRVAWVRCSAEQALRHSNTDRQQLHRDTADSLPGL
jgi:hypothetical protein